MLWRGPGSVCSTATYQKMICTSWGVLRTSSTKPKAMLRTSQLVDSRMMPTSRPSRVAATMLMAETSSVLSTQTSSARPYVSPTAHGISRNGMSKLVSSARKPKPNVACRRARLPAAWLPSSQTTPSTSASSTHCAARARDDGRLTMFSARWACTSTRPSSTDCSGHAGNPARPCRRTSCHRLRRNCRCP